jgi:AcrR family transcriptional regulator
VGRPKVPLIERDVAVAKALEIIDRDGIDGLSIRNLGKELGVNGASLYHHFQDKDEILEGVRLLIMREARVIVPQSKTATWQDYVRRSVLGYRKALISHPNAIPLMAPGRLRPRAIHAREVLLERMVEDQVPLSLAVPIMDSVEALAFGSVMLRAQQAAAQDRFAEDQATPPPNLAKAMKAAPRTPDRLFQLELQALLDGWTALIDRERAPRRGRS